MRPVEDELLLQTLDSVAVEQLRPEFVTAMRALRSRILGQAPVKTLHGRELDGPALISLAESYSHAINSGSVPNIGEAWDALCLTQNERKIDAAIAAFKAQSVTELRKHIPCPPQTLRQGFDLAVQGAVAAIRKDGYGDAAAIEACAMRLMQALGDLVDSILSENERVGADQCNQILRELHEPIQIKLQENGFGSLSEYEKQLHAMTAVYNEKAPNFSSRNEILLRFSFDALSSAAQTISSSVAASAEQACRQLRDSLESERRDAMEERMSLSKDRDIALARCDSLSSALDESKAREEAAKKSVELVATAAREEKEELKLRVKDAEGVANAKDLALRAAETQAILMERDCERLRQSIKQLESNLQEHKQQAAGVEDRLRKQLDDARSSTDAALAEVRAQFRSDLSERDLRVKEITAQLEQCRNELLAARSDAASQQQACALIQAEMSSKLSSAAAAADQAQHALRQKFDAAEAAFRSQESDLRAALAREQSSVLSMKDAVKDAQSQAAACEAARIAMSTAFEHLQQQNATIVESLKSAAPAAPTASVQSDSLIADVLACNAAAMQRLSNVHSEERAQLLEAIQRLQRNFEGMLHRQCQVEVGAALAVIESAADAKYNKDALSRNLALQEACYGSSSHHIIDSLFRLAICVGLTGDHAAKASFLERSISIIDANGSSSSLLIACLHHLACAYESLGLVNKTIVVAERALQLQQTQAPSHPFISGIVEVIGRANSHRGFHDKAAASFERALKLKEQHFGLNDMALVSCLIGLAAAHRSLGNKDQARACSERAYNICTTCLGSQHPTSAVTLAHAAYSCFVCGGDASELKLQLQRLEEASAIISNHETELSMQRMYSPPAAGTPISLLPSSPISIPITPYSTASPATNSFVKGAPSPTAVSTPLQPAPTPSSVYSLDAATVSIFLAQCLGAADSTRTSLMSYADSKSHLKEPVSVTLTHAECFDSDYFVIQVCASYGYWSPRSRADKRFYLLSIPTLHQRCFSMLALQARLVISLSSETCACAL